MIKLTLTVICDTCGRVIDSAEGKGTALGYTKARLALRIGTEERVNYRPTKHYCAECTSARKFIPLSAYRHGQ